MKILFLLTILTFGAVQAQAQSTVKFTSNKKIPVQLDHIESWFAYIPMQSYHTQDNRIVSLKPFYIMKFEMPNMLYKLFINDLKTQGKTDDLKTALPDTNAWGDGLQPYVEYYFSHPSFNRYPVIEVSRNGVQLFCNWLNEKTKTLKLKKWKGKKVKFRLPTEAEWMAAASGGDTNAVYAWKGPHMRYGKGIWTGDYMANFRRVGDGDVFRDGNGKLIIKANQNTKYHSHFMSNEQADITAPVLNYWPNAYGIFCMTGNVREMVEEEGFTKGGSWIDPGGECMIDFRNTYHKPGFPCEGFRLVAEIQ